MKTYCSLKSVNTLFLASLIALSLGCGYSKSMMPVQAGTMPTIAQLNPASGTANNSFQLQVEGTNFANNAVINFNGVAMGTTFVTDSKLQTNVPAAAVMTAGAVPVTVTNPAVAGGRYGGGTTAATSAAVSFTVN